MPPIELGATRPVGAVEIRNTLLPGTQPAGIRRETPARADAPVEAARHGAGAGTLLDPGEAPVDAERVALVRKAVEAGTYPVIPARVADAIIAAGLLLRNPK